MYTCDNCHTEINIDNPVFCCEFPVDCGCGGNPIGEHLCAECEWKRDFDVKKLDVSIMYEGEKLTTDQMEWLLNERADLVEELSMSDNTITD